MQDKADGRVKIVSDFIHTDTLMVDSLNPDIILTDTATSVIRTQNAEVVKRNPDIILSPIWLDAVSGGWKGITPIYEIYTRPGYNTTIAVARSRVLYYDSALMKHTGPRQILALKKLAYLLHLEYFDNSKEAISWELGWIK